MVKEKIEIIVNDKTIVNVGEESFDLGNVVSVSMGEAFSLKEEGKLIYIAKENKYYLKSLRGEE